MSVYVNRVLNLKKIKAIGFDMDYTVVRYDSKNFEEFAFRQTLKKLHEVRNYPVEVLDLEFDFETVIQGLVIDRKRGNLLKLSRFGKVKSSKHGTTPINFRAQQKIYGNLTIDLAESNYQSLDTMFSISNGILYAKLVDLKAAGVELPSFENIAVDIKAMLDLIHSDGSLKNEIRKNPEKYVLKDPEAVELLERLKLSGKQLLIITNSEFPYCKFLMEYAIKPYLKHFKDWTKLFDIVITLSRKPSFFNQRNSILSIDEESGMMSNWFNKVTNGVYQGGSALNLQEDLGLEGEEILYIGDHIYGDVVSLKKTCNWRTALVFEPLDSEIQALKKSQPIQNKIDTLMQEKRDLEIKFNSLDRNTGTKDKDEAIKISDRLDVINKEISEFIDTYNSHFNQHWGQMMRAGSEESRFADQVEKYACIYMTKVSDLLDYTPKTYFRPQKRILPHEMEIFE
ncbi:MAG: HAD-IG family 5'-nucleotidase [Bacteriovoracaceae bacterium]